MGPFINGRARLSWPEHSRSILVYTIVKYFLFERTGVGADGAHTLGNSPHVTSTVVNENEGHEFCKV